MLTTHLVIFFLGAGGTPPPPPPSVTSDEPRGFTHKRTFRKRELEIIDDVIDELRPKIRRAKTRKAVETAIEAVEPALMNVGYEASPIAGELLDIFRQYKLHAVNRTDLLSALDKAQEDDDDMIAILMLN